MINIIVTGSDGQLGSEIKEIARDAQWANFEFTTIAELDITDSAAVDKMISAKKYDFLINCSAYTAVDKAETEREMAFKVNSLGVETLAKACAQNNTKVVHISTDYVFDGTACKPYMESDTPNPQSVYGESKLRGEQKLMEHQPQSVIIRTSWLYSAYAHNFVKTVLKYSSERDEMRVVFDQVGTPTYAADLAKTIIQIIEKTIKGGKFIPGIYHYSNEGVTSWYDFATEITHLASLKCNIVPIETSEYPTPAQRPHYSVMNKKKIKTDYQITIPHWKTSLDKCIDRILKI